MMDSLRDLHEDRVVIVSPDAGGVEKGPGIRQKAQCAPGHCGQRRDSPNQAHAMHVIGDVEGRVAIVVDDMIDTAGTLCAGAEVLMNYGATRIVACATHAVLSGPAIERINATDALSQVIVTDTIPLWRQACALPQAPRLCLLPHCLEKRFITYIQVPR